ncbi:MFS transporter [Amycolatopsis thermophila]|uniref:MHS family proline/betaine transporter-like MFS transporter n=1 Tax=Amycolatopsis thermophila TaxID=206084 RepID=A0ABU0F679_9PSEU|nr:MFS transporter [Amycolatopsis thermophila]MDQ0383023.1 MHS family proline/betaine transporter-like MFS transporter [Amycolatopsis thermophila]
MNRDFDFTGRRRLRIITAASAGNFAEWYDWGVYGVVATIIAQKFFPGGNSALALLNTYAVFALGYLARPFGGIVFGRIGDRLGRRRALSLTILFTCFGTALMGVLPTYAQIGFVAPVLLLVCRLAQSMGAGGEYASAISFVFEHSPARRRARNVATLVATTFIGIMVGSVLARLLSSVMSASAYDAYGWRILFLLGLPFAAFGVYLRSRVEESPEFQQLTQAREEAATAATPVRDAFRWHWIAMLVFVICTASYALISTTVTSYLTTFLTSVAHLTKNDAYNVTIVSNVLVIVGTLVMGVVCDRFGLRRTLVTAGIVTAVLAVPALALAATGVGGAFAGAAAIGLCKGLLALPALLAISQIFPTAVRVTAGALAYNVAQSVFGGTGPIIGVWLNDRTGGPYGLAIYLAALAVVTAVAGGLARKVFDGGHAEQSQAGTLAVETR